MLYTRKGDNGTTKLFNCPQGKRLSKSNFIFEVLGTVDELNSSLGYVKILSKKSNNKLFIEKNKIPYENIIENIQQNLFCIQAELGGSNIHINKNHILYLEKIIYEIETILPPITSFIIPGGGETGSFLDITRALARKTERQLVRLQNTKEQIINNETIVYMNRLSSVLYALARFSNYQNGYSEKSPNYK